MKKLIGLFVALCLSLMLCACEQDAEETPTPIGNSRFEQVYCEGYTDDGVNNIGTVILVDKETGVMYLYVESGQRGGLTAMVDEDGKPLIWEGELGEANDAH